MILTTALKRNTTEAMMSPTMLQMSPLKARPLYLLEIFPVFIIFREMSPQIMPGIEIMIDTGKQKQQVMRLPRERIPKIKLMIGKVGLSSFA